MGISRKDSASGRKPFSAMPPFRSSICECVLAVSSSPCVLELGVAHKRINQDGFGHTCQGSEDTWLPWTTMSFNPMEPQSNFMCSTAQLLHCTVLAQSCALFVSRRPALRTPQPTPSARAGRLALFVAQHEAPCPQLAATLQQCSCELANFPFAVHVSS